MVVADRPRIAATLARWLDVPAERMGVALGLIDPGEQEPQDSAQLEEEDFITRKLEEARTWMAQWMRGSNKVP